MITALITFNRLMISREEIAKILASLPAKAIRKVKLQGKKYEWAEVREVELTSHVDPKVLGNHCKYEVFE